MRQTNENEILKELEIKSLSYRNLQEICKSKVLLVVLNIYFMAESSNMSKSGLKTLIFNSFQASVPFLYPWKGVREIQKKDSPLNWVNPCTEIIHLFTLVKYAKITWDERQLQASYLQLSEILTLLNMCFSNNLLLQTNQLVSYDGDNK